MDTHSFTTIVTLRNDTGDDIDSHKLDESDKNVIIPRPKTGRVYANVPWADHADHFDEHRMEIQRDGAVAFCTWQRHNMVRASKIAGVAVVSLCQAMLKSARKKLEIDGTGVKISNLHQR